MNKDELFARLTKEFEKELHLSEDLPEETVVSTIKALWHKAAGFPVSAEKTVSLPLPELTNDQTGILYQLIRLRIENTPLAYITGRQSFAGIELITDSRALIPRKETELLARKGIELAERMHLQNKQVHIMDVCCGAGNLGIALAHENKDYRVYSSDISQEAVDLTRENINNLDLSNRVFAEQGDMMSAFEKEEFYRSFDIIMCNPPYISSSKVMKMGLEKPGTEPELAFDGGMLGIRIIQKLVQDAPRFLKDSGWVIFEVGVGQGTLITQLCERKESFGIIDTVLDDKGNIRVIAAQKSKKVL